MRKTRCLAALLLVLLVCSCGSTNTASTRPNSGKNNVVITIHVAGGQGTADPDLPTLNARNGMAGPVAVPSHITWVADDPRAKLDIVWNDAAQKCVRNKRCNGNQCDAISNVLFKDATPARCDYTIVINGTGTADPGVLVDNCCPQQ